MSIVRGGLASLFLLVVMLVSTDANAQTPARFDFVFEDPGSNATATGFVVFDLDLLPNPGQIFPIEITDPMLLDLEVTVAGATQGNGTFTINDFSGVVWNTGGVALDLGPGVQVVGQPVSGGPWGPGCGPVGPQGEPGGGCGDFNLLSQAQGPGTQSYDPRGVSTAPTGVNAFVLGAAGGSAETMELTSFIRGTPTNVGVPTLSSWGWLTMVGVLLAAGLIVVRVRA